MTDDTGMLEHSLGLIPRRGEGYTTDDNARALWVALEWLTYGAEARVEDPDTTTRLQRLVDTYLSFLVWAQQEDGHFYNNFAYDRRPEPEVFSDDCQGRSLWASALAYATLPDRGRRAAAAHLFRRGIDVVQQLRFPRGWAYTLAACALLLAVADRGWHGQEPFEQSIRTDVERLADQLENRLTEAFRTHSSSTWHWFEPEMTYGNGVLPWSLFYIYQVTERRQTLEVAQSALDFLIEKMTAESGQIRPIGNQGWCTPHGISQWDQQPLEVMKLAIAAGAAYTVTGQTGYRDVVAKCREWFFGENDLRAMVANEQEGSSCDGLTPHGVNMNQGAESTLSYLLTEAVHTKVAAGLTSLTLSARRDIRAKEQLMA
jgi:hypothetical protein